MKKFREMEINQEGLVNSLSEKLDGYWQEEELAKSLKEIEVCY